MRGFLRSWVIAAGRQIVAARRAPESRVDEETAEATRLAVERQRQEAEAAEIAYRTTLRATRRAAAELRRQLEQAEADRLQRAIDERVADELAHTDAARKATLRERYRPLMEAGKLPRIYRSTRGWIGEDGRPADPELVELRNAG